MDTDYEYPIYGWTATNHYNETLDLFYHRWQTGREAQEIFLEQNPLYLEAESGQPQQVQAVTGLITEDDAQVAASWNSLWDEEEDSDNTEQEEDNNSFCYCLSPERVCSMESVTSTGGTVVSFSFIGDEGGREFPSTGGQNNEDSPRFDRPTDRSEVSAQDLTMPSPHTSPDPSRSSRVTNTKHLDKGKGHDLSGLDLDRRLSSDVHAQDDPQNDKPTHGMRWEPVTVMLGNWEKEYSVLKPYADYTDVPSPIILPGSPPQRPPKPSLSAFYKVPTVRDAYGDYLHFRRRNRNVKEVSPPAPPLPFPEHIAGQNQNLRRRQRSNSDISFLDLGDPYQPLDANHLAGDASTTISLSMSTSVGPSASGHLTTTSIYQPLVSPPPVTLNPVQGLRRRRGLDGTSLSVQIPAGSDPRRSASGSPQSKVASTTSSLGATFQLDEELNASMPFPLSYLF
ncbi:uncharacterized protein BHQ10_000575 [Talaromyces amestolkiae]|uniref:Uncharacterized protein n=1 Tax=Talaromyces amestolkiae TaxID=1196081 RepID=A0A364KM00_TALAM|nr:uncharacterized protein BHQ10_000575 [Talaromyces amestolkiae]RAO64563.1 hypothetical protein BHQ10_000575 [Talaromyces amestolkiae]